MKKTAIAAALSIAMGAGAAQAAQISVGSASSTTGNNFTMLDGGGGFVGGSNNVDMTWDGTAFTSNSDYTGPGGASNMTLSSPDAFFGQNWTAHSIQVFAPGTYTFDATTGGGVSETGTLSMSVDSNQLGAHMLFDWGSNANIDVVVVWDFNSPFTGDQTLTGSQIWDVASMDDDGDGVNGVGMPAGGPFAGFNANFNLNGVSVSTSPVPVPAAVWLFGSGLLGLVGVARRRKAA